MQQRLQIIILHSCRIAKKTIAWFFEKSVQTINRWITRFNNNNDLNDKKRSGRPVIFNNSIKLKIIAFYLHNTSIQGSNLKSLSWAEGYLNKNPEILGCKSSRSLVYRSIMNHALKPHRNKYFLNITDPDFFPKMDDIIKLYTNPPEYLFNYDECTGIQATGALYPDLPVISNKYHYQEFDYSRNGRTDLLAFFNTKTGKVFGDCFTNHNSDTFSLLFKRHVQMFPKESMLHYIMDNLSTHYTDTFCQIVAELSGVTYSPLKTGKKRQEWLRSEEKRIVIHFTPFHGSWLNLIEIWFGIFNQKCLKQKRFNDVYSLVDHILAFIKTWNEYFAHPFSWNYTGEGLHEKVVKRLNTLFAIESDQVNINFLINQLHLVKNIYNQYPEIQKANEWTDFLRLFNNKAGYIQNIISISGKPKQIEKAWNIYEELCTILNCHINY